MLRKKSNNYILFLFSAIAGLNFNIVGRLGYHEILAAFSSLSIQKWRKLYIEVPDIKKVNIAYLFFLFSQVLSDLINHSDSNDFIRGWANILMAIVVLNFLAINLIGNEGAIILYLLGDLVKLLFFRAQVFDYSIDSLGEDMGVFKYWVAPILNNIIILACYYLLKKKKSSKGKITTLFFLYGLFCFALDFRSNGLFFILTGIIFYNISILKGLSFKKLVPYAIIFIFLFQGLYIVYVNEVKSGSLGGVHAQEQLKRIENPYNPFYLLLTGRAETFVAFAAITEKPIFGHGSWAPDPTGIYTLMAYKLHDEEDKFETRMDNLETKLIIPSHSVLMGSWLTSGIIGFFSVLYILVLFILRSYKSLCITHVQNGPFVHIIIFFLLNGFWVFLFSPLPQIKDTLPIMIAFILVYSKGVKLDIKK